MEQMEQGSDDLHARVVRLVEHFPSLVPYFEEIIEQIEELKIDVDDVLALMRVYRRSPTFVYLLMGMMDMVFNAESSAETPTERRRMRPRPSQAD